MSENASLYIIDLFRGHVYENYNRSKNYLIKILTNCKNFMELDYVKIIIKNQ